MPRRRKKPATRTLVAAGAGLVVLVVAGAFAYWAVQPRSGDGHAVELVWNPEGGASSGASLLAASGVIDDPLLFTVLLTLARPLVTPEGGPHLLTDDLTPFEVLRRLVRLASRARAKVVIPEGFNRFQIAERLERQRVCSSQAFTLAATNPASLAAAGVSGDSAEGFLFPATYDFYADTDPEAVLRDLAALASKRYAALKDKHAAGFTRVEEKYGWSLREILALASVIEKEAVKADEQAVIASVFFNRLDSADFKPARSLQSDPTALYGCLVNPVLASCAGAAGKVTPTMLRDFANPYNTYRHPGLPPGPIANPGLGAIEAVLEPASTDFLFFVAGSDGRHVFSRTLEEHDAAIKRPR